MTRPRLSSSFSFFYIFRLSSFSLFFFFNDTATTEIYTLSLHDALPISSKASATAQPAAPNHAQKPAMEHLQKADRKSTRLNSSHLVISYAVFCLKKKKKTNERGAATIKLDISHVLHPSSVLSPAR